ncbi:MAG: hypothetical protein QM498_12650, partial [Desulfobacterium sp.]
EKIISKVGSTATFEHKNERNFIMSPDKDEVFSHLVDTFMKISFPYLSRPYFPEKYILKCYMQ